MHMHKRARTRGHTHTRSLTHAHRPSVPLTPRLPCTCPALPLFAARAPWSSPTPFTPLPPPSPPPPGWRHQLLPAGAAGHAAPQRGHHAVHHLPVRGVHGPDVAADGRNDQRAAEGVQAGGRAGGLRCGAVRRIQQRLCGGVGRGMGVGWEGVCVLKPHACGKGPTTPHATTSAPPLRAPPTS